MMKMLFVVQDLTNSNTRPEKDSFKMIGDIELRFHYEKIKQFAEITEKVLGEQIDIIVYN